MALDVDGIIAQLKDASILELNDLVKSIEDEFGVKAAAPVAAGAAAGADAAAAKDTYDVELTEAGQEKLRLSRLFVKSLVLA
ncbi:50S ribosomal protein L7/L12 [Lacticaseibacillus paracasei subsp. paracasei Lpp125]|nr:50S ribosomal protein L7/L12 [Lacticaseibacillus paracasei subsp. paracasei Lpp125]